jgi:predicted patatin/cPLA2 family phospholipase
MLRKYPNMIKTMEERYLMYNEQKRYIREKEEKGEIEVIRPVAPLNISPVEKDPNELERVYQLGRAEGTKYLNR